MVRSFPWNRFPIKNFPIDSLITSTVENAYLGIDRLMCKFESSPKDESRAQSVDSSKAYGKSRAFDSIFHKIVSNLSSLEIDLHAAH